MNKLREAVDKFFEWLEDIEPEYSVEESMEFDDKDTSTT